MILVDLCGLTCLGVGVSGIGGACGFGGGGGGGCVFLGKKRLGPVFLHALRTCLLNVGGCALHILVK